MSIPDYQTLMLPVLETLGDGKEWPVSGLRDALAKRLGLTEQERQILIPSGRQTLFNTRCGWAKTYLAKAGLLEPVRRGVYRISARGCAVLAERLPRIDVSVLARFPEFEDFISRSESEETPGGPVSSAAVTSSESKATATAPLSETPQEVLERAHAQIRRELESEVLAAVRAANFRFFERLVVELLVKMGYGGSLKDAGRAIGRTGDDGLDGVIKEDHLGLDAIYVQAKHWAGTVGRPHVQNFAGSLEGVRGRKGVFITTSSFSGEAREYVSRIEKKIVLIDGLQLAAL